MLAEDILIYLRASAILGILPFYNLKKLEFRIFPILPIILILMTLTAQICTTSYAIYNGEKSFHLVEPIVNVCMNVQMMINLNFLRLESIQHLFGNFNEIDLDFQKLHRVSVKPLKFVALTFVIINVIFFTMTFIYFYLFGMQYTYYEHLMNLLGNVFSTYNINLIEFLKLLVIYSILRRFKLYNDMTIGIDASDIFVGQRKIEQYIKMHRKLCDLVDGFNRIYGWSMLLSIMQTIVYILRLCIILLHLNGAGYYVYYVIMWVIYVVVQSIAVATMCEKVANEGQKCITLAYKALQRYNNIPVMREKLMILAQQSTARVPKFTAAGFFNVDFSMLFTFVNLITTYVIVIIQFSQSSQLTVT